MSEIIQEKGSEQIAPQIVKPPRNSIVELLRFLCALVVVNGHGYFPWKGRYFTSGTLIVEFFFVLSGYLFFASYKKVENEPFFKGAGIFLWKRLKGLGLIFAIGSAHAFARFILLKGVGVGLFGYLWYVPRMFLGYAVLMICRKLVRGDDKRFMLVCLSIGVLALALRFGIYMLNDWGEVRMLSSMPLGVVMAMLPKIRLKSSAKRAICIGTGFVVSLVGAMLFAGILQRFWYNQLFLTAVFYPALLYFTMQISFENRVFDYLGALSFGLYSFQCVLWLLVELGFTNVYALFFLLVSLCIVSTPNAFEKLFKKSKK